VLIPAQWNSEQQPSSQLYGAFFSTVLSLRGTAIVKQPLQDDKTGSILCWNGEAWSLRGHYDSITGNDSQLIFDMLLQQSHLTPIDDRKTSLRRIVGIFSSIRGPHAFVFYDARHQYLYYGRDCLGRRSLLRKSISDHYLILSSVCDNATGDNWAEVEADGIYVVDLERTINQAVLDHYHIPHSRQSESSPDGPSFVGKFPYSSKFTKSISAYHSLR